MGAGSALAYHTLYLEHFQRSSFARVGGGLGPAFGSSAQREDGAVDGVHKPGQGQRQILLGFADVIDDVSNEKKKTKNFRIFIYINT
ncbi:unnamed protein product [Prunus armeniaca]